MFLDILRLILINKLRLGQFREIRFNLDEISILAKKVMYLSFQLSMKFKTAKFSSLDQIQLIFPADMIFSN